jgi:hypothetical protein
MAAGFKHKENKLQDKNCQRKRTELRQRRLGLGGFLEKLCLPQRLMRRAIWSPELRGESSRPPFNNLRTHETGAGAARDLSPCASTKGGVFILLVEVKG